MAADADEPRRVEGPTPNGGAYALLYTHDDGSREAVEFDEHDERIASTYFQSPDRMKREQPYDGPPILD